MSGISCAQETNRDPVILFIGAGVSFSSGVRTANSLKEMVVQEIPVNEAERKNIRANCISIQELADYLEIRASPSIKYAFKEAIARNLYSRSPITSTEYRMLAFLVKKKLVDAIYTTNQDVCLERALDSQGIPYNRYVYPYVGKELQSHANENVDIFKLCGDVHTPYEMCFSKKELQNASKSRLFRSLTKRFTQNCRIVFIGYSASMDPIGECLRQASAGRAHRNNRATLFCVDRKEQSGHRELIKTDYGDCTIIKTAEEYLMEEIFQIKPEITVKHALFDTTGFGGVQTYAYSLMALQEEFGEKITSSCYATRTFYNRSRSIEDHVYGFSYDLASSKAETAKAICVDRSDVIHAHNFIAAQMADTLGVPCVFTSHSLESKEMKASSGKRIFAIGKFHEDPFVKDIPKYEDIYYRQLPSIFALSQAHIDEFHEDVKPAAKKELAPFLSPEILHIDTTVTSQKKREELQKYDWAPKCIVSNGGENGMLAKETPTIAFFGRPDKRKGLHVFDRVVEILDQKGQNFQALYVGPKIVVGDDNKLKIEEEKTSYNQTYYQLYEDERTVEPQIQQRMFVATEVADDYTSSTFKDHLAKMYDFYLASDIIIIPSSYETFGYVALEAMACRRPVIASSIGGLKELLGDGRGTLIDIEGSDHEETTEFLAQQIASSVIEILNHHAADQVSKAKAWVDREYSRENMSQMVKKMYDYYLESIIRGRKKVKNDSKIIDHVMSYYLCDIESWDALLVRTPTAYQALLKQLYASSAECTEVYDLFWNIAYWLKANKSMCPEVSIMPIKELAELITVVTRCLPKHTSEQETFAGDESYLS